MIDMVFYHNKKIYTYFNQHNAKPIPQASFEAENLCKTEEEVKADPDTKKPIFMNYSDLNGAQKTDGGNEFITIQNLQDTVGNGDQLNGLVNPDIN